MNYKDFFFYAHTDAVTLSDRTVAFIMYRYSLLKPLMQKKKNVHNRDGVTRRGIGG